jgi:L-ribulose-5-phosphate 3-epimerase
VSGSKPTLPIGMTGAALRGAGENLFAAARAAGLDGVELGVQGEYPADPFWDAATRRRLAEQAAADGIALPSPILSTVGRLDFPEDATARALGLEMTRATILACAEVGITVMMIPCFKQHRFTTIAQIERATADLRLLAPMAEDAGVVIGLETLLPAGANRWLLEAVHSPALRLYYDAANTARYGWDPLFEIPKLAHTICQHHVKPADVPLGGMVPAGRAPNPPMRLGEGTWNLRATVAAILATGYDGWLILETRPTGDALTDARHNVRTLREWIS